MFEGNIIDKWTISGISLLLYARVFNRGFSARSHSHCQYCLVEGIGKYFYVSSTCGFQFLKRELSHKSVGHMARKGHSIVINLKPYNVGPLR